MQNTIRVPVRCAGNHFSGAVTTTPVLAEILSNSFRCPVCGCGLVPVQESKTAKVTLKTAPKVEHSLPTWSM